MNNKRKEEIKDFCDKLFEILPKHRDKETDFYELFGRTYFAADTPGHSIFGMSDKEMLKVIKKYYSDDLNKPIITSASDALGSRWEKMTKAYIDEFKTFDIEYFKNAFYWTWNYFLQSLDAFGINNIDLHLIGLMYIFSNNLKCPQNIEPNAFCAAKTVVRELLRKVTDNSARTTKNYNFYDGYLVINAYDNSDMIVSHDSFYEDFDELVQFLNNKSIKQL